MPSPGQVQPETMHASSSKQEEVEVELVLPTTKDDNNSCSNPSSSPPSPSQRTMAQKRWALLKTVTRFQSALKSSLRKEERDLLNLIDEERRREEEELHEDDHCEDRKDLSKLIHHHRSSLSHKETDYLRKLIASPEVSSDTVARARKSIEVSAARRASYLSDLSGIGDSIAEFDTEDDDDLDDDDDGDTKPLRHQNDASFRKELWTTDSSKNLSETQTQQQSREEKKEEDESDHNNKDKDNSPSWKNEGSFFGLFFGGGGGKQSEDSNKSKHEDAAVDNDNDDDDDDDNIEYAILGTSADDDDCHPHVLTPPIMNQLRKHLPYVVSNDNFWLRYSMVRDGASMRSLVQKMHNSARSIVAIESVKGDVFGAFCSSPWMPRGGEYFGSGEAFLWRMEESRYTPCETVDDQVALESNITVFKWSGENRNVQRLERVDSQLVMGGGGPDVAEFNVGTAEVATGDDGQFGCGLVVYPDLETGYSNPCLTFKSPALPPSASSQEFSASDNDNSFEIANIEVWTLTPVTTVDQAEQVELGRRFIFDHSDFIET